jgi:hypothetical protein
VAEKVGSQTPGVIMQIGAERDAGRGKHSSSAINQLLRYARHGRRGSAKVRNLSGFQQAPK